MNLLLLLALPMAALATLASADDEGAVEAGRSATDSLSPQAPIRTASSADAVQRARAMIAAMSGEWSGAMRAEVPPATEEFPWRVSCAPIARGAGLLCHSGGTGSIGPIAQSCLLAVAPGDEEVHLMCVSSIGEVHDHRGRYYGGVIRFVPLRARIAGEIAEELVEYRIAPSGNMRTVSIVRRTGRPEMRFTLQARRSSGSGEVP